jgi:hypothetical protein
MNRSLRSPAYLAVVEAGPFPGRLDPWAEDDGYFSQIHGGMIGQLIEQMRDQLLPRGYSISREASLQILGERRKPDLWIADRMPERQPDPAWDYTAAAQGVLIEPGIETEIEITLDAVHITEVNTGELVTVVEVVSPGNKSRRNNLHEYQDFRDRLISQRVHVVEIDATRSFAHLYDHPLVRRYAYHTAVHLNDGRHFVLGSFYDQPLRRFALPLREEVVAIDPHIAYQYGYRAVSIAEKLESRNAYTEEHLPFPSLLTARDRAELLARVEAWRERLAQLSATHENGA